MKPLKEWLGPGVDCGTRRFGDLGLFRIQRCRCRRYDGKEAQFVYWGSIPGKSICVQPFDLFDSEIEKMYAGKTSGGCRKYRTEFTRVGCFCWTQKENCYNVPECPLHPYGGICGMDLEMDRCRTVEEENGVITVYYTQEFNWTDQKCLARIGPDYSVEYYGSLKMHLDAHVAQLAEHSTLNR